MSGLWRAGLIALAFGVGSYYATGEMGLFGQVNLVAGALALVAALLLAARRATRGFGTPVARGLLLRRGLQLAALIALAFALERGAARLGVVQDWTLDQRYVLSPASQEVLAALPDDLTATLYYDPEDPRIRGTRLLLRAFAAEGPLTVRERVLDEAADEADALGVLSSNTVVIESQGRAEVVGRPAEGTVWEALERLRSRQDRAIVYFSRGAGEGDLLRRDDLGYSGLAAALQTQGYRLRDLVLAATERIPDDAAALLVIAPERPLRAESVTRIREYLERGGGLVAFLDPGRDGGILGLLEAYGFESPDAAVIDPASGPIEGDAPGVNPLAFAYTDHPITQPLDANRMTFFLRARPVRAATKPRPRDRLESIVYSSDRAWLSRDFAAIDRGQPPRDRDGQPDGRFPLVAVGRYPLGADEAQGEARVAVFGDSGLASNAYLRTLYNLDLVMNAIGWVAERESARLTRRPNVLTNIQSPITPQETLTMFYGVGLLLPEIFLIAGVLAWARRQGG
jgi:hypothetical protein